MRGSLPAIYKATSSNNDQTSVRAESVNKDDEYDLNQSASNKFNLRSRRRNIESIDVNSKVNHDRLKIVKGSQDLVRYNSRDKMREMNNSNSTAHSKAQNKDRNDFGRNEDLVIIDNDLLTRFKGKINTRDRI